MRSSLRLRPMVLGLLLLTGGVLQVIASGQRAERLSTTLAPGVWLARAAGDNWLLLMESEDNDSDGPAGTVEAEQVTQYGMLQDGRVVVEGSIDGAASWIVIGGSTGEVPVPGPEVLGVFPTRESLQGYLARQSLSMPSLSLPQAAGHDSWRLWMGIGCIVAGMGILGVGILLRAGYDRGRNVSHAPRPDLKRPRGADAQWPEPQV